MKKAIYSLGWITILIAAIFACAETHTQPSTCVVQVPQNHIEPANNRELKLSPSTNLSSIEINCIEYMLRASSINEVERRYRACKSTPSLQMSYAYMLLKLHAPNAEDEVVEAIPKNSAEMRQLYFFSSVSDLGGRAYEKYYNRLFVLGKTRAGLLPRLFAVGAQYGTNNPNVDEDVWFCENLEKIYRDMPHAYMEAVKQAKSASYRRYALDCRTGSRF